MHIWTLICTRYNRVHITYARCICDTYNHDIIMYLCVCVCMCMYLVFIGSVSSMGFGQVEPMWCLVGLTPQILYNQYLWCHYKIYFIALYTSTGPRNHSFKCKTKLVVRRVWQCQEPCTCFRPSHVSCLNCPSSFSASVHGAFNISSLFPISDTSNLFNYCIACPDHVTVTWLCAQYGSDF